MGNLLKDLQFYDLFLMYELKIRVVIFEEISDDSLVCIFTKHNEFRLSINEEVRTGKLIFSFFRSFPRSKEKRTRSFSRM